MKDKKTLFGKKWKLKKDFKGQKKGKKVKIENMGYPQDDDVWPIEIDGEIVEIRHIKLDDLLEEDTE
jgi:hypothetical protein